MSWNLWKLLTNGGAWQHGGCKSSVALQEVLQPAVQAVLSEKILPPCICERCGACCAFFPVTFPDDETINGVNGVLLVDFSLPSGKCRRIMRGTELKPPRCIALEGEVGVRVRCVVYENRPSTCRNFKRSWEDNVGNTLCDRARTVFGMQPFSQY